MKTHYELLGVESSADGDAIKKAFRREIARYHPDKVIHLGTEFQEMASTRAAELTVAYKTLTDAALRQEYDASLAAGDAPPDQPHPSPPQPSPDIAAREPISGGGAPAGENEPAGPRRGSGRFTAARADRDAILNRAVAGRVQSAVERMYGSLETPPVRGFDLAMVPTAKARLLGTAPPRVLIKILAAVTADAINDAYTWASRARVHSGKSPVVAMLLARSIPPQHEISRAHEAIARHPRTPDGPEEIAVVIVDTADWSCRLPPNSSKEVHRLANALYEQ